MLLRVKELLNVVAIFPLLVATNGLCKRRGCHELKCLALLRLVELLGPPHYSLRALLVASLGLLFLLPLLLR
jgi:hypothetical protein